MNCVKRTEQDLHWECVSYYTNKGWSVVGYEWLVIPRKEMYGRGDLVFLKGKEYRVIECKRKPHPNVFEQAKFYGAAWKLLYAKPKYKVNYGIWTCTKKRIIGTVTNAQKMCKRKVPCKIILDKYK